VLSFGTCCLPFLLQLSEFLSHIGRIIIIIIIIIIMNTSDKAAEVQTNHEYEKQPTKTIKSTQTRKLRTENAQSTRPEKGHSSTTIIIVF